MEFLSKVFGVLIAIALLILVPLYYTYDRQDDLARIVAHDAVTNFVDAARNKGFITPTMYNDFANELNRTGYDFDISMTHLKKAYYPVYSDPANPDTFQNRFTIEYDEYYSDEIMSVLYPNTTLPIDSINRRYEMNYGDFFRVEVKNIERTKAMMMRDFIIRANTGDVTVINIPYGGMVHNEDY